MDGVAEIGPIISEAEATKSAEKNPERRYNRGEVLLAFNSTLDLLNGIPKDQLTPKEQADIDLVNEIKGKTIDKGRASYVNRFKDEKGNEYSQREYIPVESLINFLNVNIESGKLSEDEKKDYEERRRIIARHSKQFYDLPHRLEPSRLNNRVHQEFERVQRDSRLNIGNWEASDLINGRRELILPRETKEKDNKEDKDKKDGGDKDKQKEEKEEEKKEEDKDEVRGKKEEREEEDTVQKIRRDIAITNRTTDPRKRAAELAEEFLRSEMRRGSILNPLNWGRKVGLRVMEEYWRQRLIQQIETSMLENNNSLLTLDMVRSSIRARDLFKGGIQNVNLDVNANKAREQSEGQDTNKQLRLSTQDNTLISGQRVEEAQGTLRDMMVSEIIRPLVEGSITADQIQDRLREFVRTHQSDPQVLAIFGPNSNQYSRIATYFATDLKETAKAIREDIAAHKYAIGQLNEVVRIQLANTDWAAETEAKFTRADRAVAWAERHRLSGLLANPAVIGAAFSLGTFAALRATGAAAKVSQFIVPGAGLLPAALFAGFRRNYDLKVDRASHQVERAYNRQIPPDAPRREALERYAYNTASVTELLNGGGQELVGGSTRLSLENLLATDLTITSNQETLMRRITEMKSRLNFSAEHSIDLVTFESRGQVSQGRLQLIEAIARAHIALRNAGVADDVVGREETRLTGEWRTRLVANREQQDKSFAHYRLRQSLMAGAFGGAVGLAGSFVTQEAWAGIGRGVFHQQIGNTALENAFSGKPISEWFGPTRAAGFAIDQAKELYEHPGNLQISDKLTLAIDANHTGSIIDAATGNKIPTPPLHLTENGQLVFSGKMDNLPTQVRDLIGGWENRVNTNPAFNLQEHLKTAAVAPEGSGHETFQHGDWVVDVNSGPNHQMSMTHWPTQTKLDGFIKTGGSLSIDQSFGGNTQLNNTEWQDMQKLLTANGWATSSETVSGRSIFGPEGEWKNYSTNVDHREWYSYDRPGSQHNELRFDDYKDGGKVILDMNRMQLGYQNGLNPNPINIQEVIQNREGGFYFSTPDTPQDGIWVPDGADGIWDGKLALDPNDLDPTHIIQTSKGPLQLGEFSKMVLNQDALQKYPNGNIATEVFDRQDVFNLGQGGKDGFIEAGRMLNKDGVNVLQDFATIRGITEAQPTIPKEIFTFEPPIATEFDPPPPTELEPPPLIPIPFAPRFPLEPMDLPPNEKIIYTNVYFREPTNEQKKEFEARRSPRLKENRRAILDPKQELGWYFEQQNPQYVQELREINTQVGKNMEENCRLCVVMPVAAHQEEANIYKALENYASQRDRVTGQPLDRTEYEVLIFLNRPSNKEPDGTEREIERFTRDHPDVKVRIARKIFKPEEVKYGRIVKYLNDLALLRSQNRTNPDNRDLILVTNDADSTAMSRFYIQDIIKEFEKPSNRNIDGILGKLEWSQEAYDRYPVFHAATRFAQYIDTIYRHDYYPTLGSPGGNFALRSSIYAAVGGYFGNTGAGADQDLSRLIRYARVGRLGGIHVKDYPIKYLNKAWLESNPRRGIDYYKQGVPFINQWDDFNKRMAEDDPARLSRWQEITEDSESLSEFDVSRLESEMNAILETYGLDEGEPAIKRALEWMGVEATLEGNKLKITKTSQLMAGLKRYRDQNLSQLKKQEKAPTPQTTPGHRQPQRQTSQQPAPEQTRTTPGSISELANRALTQATSNQASVEATPQALSTTLSSFDIPLGGRINAQTGISGNQLNMTGAIGTTLGTARFTATLATDQNGQLQVVQHELTSIPIGLKGQKEMLERQVSELNLSIANQIKNQTNPGWEVSGFHIADGKMVLDYTKKAAPVQTPPAQAETLEQPPSETTLTATPTADQVLQQVRREGAEQVQQMATRAQEIAQNAREQLRLDHENRMRTIIEGYAREKNISFEEASRRLGHQPTKTDTAQPQRRPGGPLHNVDQKMQEEAYREPTQPVGLLNQVNRTLTESAESQTVIETSPQEVVNYLKTLDFSMGTKISGATSQIINNQLIINGSANMIVGAARFKATLATDQDGKLSVINHQVNLPLLASGKQGEIEQQITNINQLLIDKINGQINPAWEATGMRIDGNNLAFDFKKKERVK